MRHDFAYWLLSFPTHLERNMVFFCLFVSFRNIRTKNHTLHILPSLRVSIGIGQPVAHVFVCATIQDLSQNVNNCSSIYFFIVFTSSSFASCLLFSWTLEDASSSCCRSIWSWLEACQKASLKPKACFEALMRFATKTGLLLYSFPFKTGLPEPGECSPRKLLNLCKTWARPWPENATWKPSQKLRNSDSWSSWGSRYRSCIFFSFLSVFTVGGVSQFSDAERISYNNIQ